MSSSGQNLPPRVAILLLNWENWRDTIDCLESLQRLAYRNFYVLVVDNGSRDDSLANLEKFATERGSMDPPLPITIIRNPANYGFARGCNVGIERVLADASDFVWLLNNDTRVEPNALTALVEAALSDPAIGAVGGLLCDMDRPSQVHEWGGGWISLTWGFSRTFTAAPRPRCLDYLCGGCLLIRRAALLATGSLDPGYFMYGEDADFGLRLRQDGWQLAVATDARIRHRHGVSLPSLARYYYGSAATARTLRKHSRCALPALLCVTSARALTNTARGRWRRSAAILSGAWAGWLAYSRKVPYGPAPAHLTAKPAPAGGRT